MPGSKEWAYILTAGTIVLWGGLRLVDRSLPTWILVLAGLVVAALLTAHYANQYTA